METCGCWFSFYGGLHPLKSHHHHQIYHIIIIIILIINGATFSSLFRGWRGFRPRYEKWKKKGQKYPVKWVTLTFTPLILKRILQNVEIALHYTPPVLLEYAFSLQSTIITMILCIWLGVRVLEENDCYITFVGISYVVISAFTILKY